MNVLKSGRFWGCNIVSARHHFKAVNAPLRDKKHQVSIYLDIDVHIVLILCDYRSLLKGRHSPRRRQRTDNAGAPKTRHGFVNRHR